jgi:dephospho-CoA kinase
VKFTVGLTGGIGSGKSTVAALLARHGAGVVDTDEISHALTGPAGAAMAAIGQAFGAGFVAADGSLDRAAMRKAAFADDAARARLEAILHPLIRERSERAVSLAPGPYAVLVVPLLFESGGRAGRYSRTLVVDCPQAQQIARVARRSGLAEEEVRAIMARQWPRWRRLQLADDVVWNGGELAGLEAACERLHAAYALAAARGAS